MWPTVVSPADRLHLVDRQLVRPALQRLLDAAMLVAERDLEVEDALAVALETEVPRLDDTGVDGADGDLVDLVPLHAEEGRHAGDRLLARSATEGVPPRPPRTPEPHRFQPRMALRLHAELLGDLPLEEVRLRAERA